MPETTNDTCSSYALVAADRLIRREPLLPLLTALVAGSGLFDPVRFDGSDAALADVLDEVRTATLLGGLRVVVVDNADTFITANRAALERYSSDPSNTGCLILLCNTLPRNTRLFKIIQAARRIVPFEAPQAGAAPGRRETVLLSWYADMSTRTMLSSSSNMNSASARASSVFPTPVGPRKMKLAIGRFGSAKPERARRMASASAEIAASCPITRS